jgi:uncharacterized SAM-binding protein YcdF (DUF218 family)
MVGVAALVAWLWTTRARPLPAVATAALGLLWLAVAFTPLTSLLAEGLVRRDPPATADAIVVLSSRIQKDGELSATAMSRLLHGLELLAQGRAPRLVVTEAPPPSPSHAAPARALMEALRLEGELLAVGPVYDTREEARAVRGLFAERGFRSLVLVTSPTHSRRACLTFEKQGLVVASSPAVETDFDLETFETADDRLRAFGPVLHERLGLLLYRWRGDL